ncbi:MAG: hypothetical protein B6241_00410 [Spirochaetaceae bacterium 4572_59]|nr:MAG: hypothetical protein B6241_00410 [Spirochaetaceae bacterium 4572_59]
MKKHQHKFSRKKSASNLPVKIYYLAQILSFLSITLLTVLLIRFNLHEKKILAKMHMDQSTMKLLSAFLTDTTDMFLTRAPEIEGIVIYEADGTTLFSYGEIIRDPRIYNYDELNIINTDSKRSLLLSNSVINMQRDFPPERTRFLDNKYIGNDIIFHIEEKNQRFFHDIRKLIYIQIIIHLITLLIFMQAHRFYQKSSSMREQLKSQENLVILGSALRTLTHEMKNPLAAIRLQSGFINRLYPEDLKEETYVINCEVERLSHLMGTVRDYLKNPVGNQESIDPSSFLHKIRKLYPSVIKWIIPEEKYSITIDPDKFRSILENLLNNAMESGSEPDKITVEINKVKKWIYISVRDEGSGIPEDIKERIFDPFFTTKSRGSGVGLMISKRFLEAVGGNLEIESTEGKMTEVLFWVPTNNKGKNQ